MPKRVPLSARRAKDIKGVDALFEPAEKPQPAKQELAKVTLYVRPDQIVAIEKIQLAERQRTGKRPDKSDLVQEALDLLIKKYSPH